MLTKRNRQQYFHSPFNPCCDTKSRLSLLRRAKSRMQPGILLPVSYRGMRREQSRGVKPSEQCSLALKSDRRTVRGSGDYQHQGGRELGPDRMVNISELLINVVRNSKPKLLIGLSQNGKGPGTGTHGFPVAARSASGEQAGPKRSTLGETRNVVSPYYSRKLRLIRRSLAGRKVARPTNGVRVRDSGESERLLVTGRIGICVDGAIRPTKCSHAKAGKLPESTSSRESLPNRHRGQSR